MFIDVSENNGKPYLRLAKSVRAENSSGKKVSRKEVLLNIGPVDKFDDGMPDFIGRLRKSFKAGRPLIATLEPYCDKQAPRERYTFTFEEGSPECVGTPKLYSHLFLAFP